MALFVSVAEVGDWIEPAAAPELADSMEPEPLMPDASFVTVEDWRMDVVSDVEVTVPDSRSADVPMRSVSLLLQPKPTSATRSAVVNKDFFISPFSCSLKTWSRKLESPAPRLSRLKTFVLGRGFQYGDEP